MTALCHGYCVLRLADGSGTQYGEHAIHGVLAVTAHGGLGGCRIASLDGLDDDLMFAD